MKRFHEEIAVMKKRIREAKLFGLYEGSKGWFRKRKHYYSCSPNQHCRCCEMRRSQIKQENKKERVKGKLDTRNEVKRFESGSNC